MLMLGSQQLGARYSSSVVRLMIEQFKNMRKKPRTKVERVGPSHDKESGAEAWNLLRSTDSVKVWFPLIWNKFVNPRLACLSWCLMHGRTPTEDWAKKKGWSLASRCHNCLNGE